jgi:hypothetical protein
MGVKFGFLHYGKYVKVLKNMVLRTVLCPNKEKVKGKAVPLQAWRGPEGSRRLKLPDFKTIST